ncbi:MAG: hypothetical protein HRJ53_18885, partial [Acidobacteria bacterium Pan2503]|nr:hypothetical protein [Candidatus Acidoferrum panamensis]
MLKKFRTNSIGFLLGSLALGLALFAPNAFAASPSDVTLTVTAVGKKDMTPPAVTKDVVQFYRNKERTQIADWRRGEKLYLAVLIDDSLDTTAGNQWGELKDFFNAQPPTT